MLKHIAAVTVRPRHTCYFIIYIFIYTHLSMCQTSLLLNVSQKLWIALTSSLTLYNIKYVKGIDL